MDIAALAAGAALGGLIAWLALRGRSAALAERAAQASARAAQLDAELAAARGRETDAATRVAQAETRAAAERDAGERQQRLLDEARARLADAFQALSADALRANNQAFLDLARTQLAGVQQQGRDELAARGIAIQHLVAPLNEALGRVTTQVAALAQARTAADAALGEQVKALAQQQHRCWRRPARSPRR